MSLQVQLLDKHALIFIVHHAVLCDLLKPFSEVNMISIETNYPSTAGYELCIIPN